MQVIDKLSFQSKREVWTVVELNWDYKAKVCWEVDSVQKDHRVTARINKVYFCVKIGQKVQLTATTETECRTWMNCTNK